MRTLPPLRLSKSPLVLVLAQVKTSPVLQMAEYVPKIQERLRHQGFPRFKLNRTQQIVLGPKPIFGTHERWLFSNKELTQTVALATDFVALEASAYTVFEDFVAVLGSVLEVVGSEAQISHSDRLGLRYVDLIRLAEGESFRNYLKPGLHGVEAEALGAQSTLIQLQISADTNMGTQYVRVWQTTDGKFLPPDLEGEDLSFKDVPQAGELLTILDLDHFSVHEREFDPPEIIAEMWRLHDGSDRAFRAAVTEVALSRWGAEPV